MAAPSGGGQKGLGGSYLLQAKVGTLAARDTGAEREPDTGLTACLCPISATKTLTSLHGHHELRCPQGSPEGLASHQQELLQVHAHWAY